MGAGASMPKDKLDYFKERLLHVDTMSDAQKDRLLELMSAEVRKVMGNAETPESRAAAKIQAVSRQRATQVTLTAGLKSGQTLEEVGNLDCTTILVVFLPR